MKLHLIIKFAFLTSALFLGTQAIAEDQMSNGNRDTATPTKIVAKTPEDDAVITKTLKDLIQHSKILSKLDVKISTNKGIVTLTGNVDSDTQASSLIEHAESIIGVSDVDASNLTVKNSQQPLKDMIITAKVKGLMIREELLGEKDIAAINTSVETKNGIVYLSGVIDNEKQIDNAIDIIKKSVPEVKKVEYIVKKITPVS